MNVNRINSTDVCAFGYMCHRIYYIRVYACVGRMLNIENYYTLFSFFRHTVQFIDVRCSVSLTLFNCLQFVCVCVQLIYICASTASLIWGALVQKKFSDKKKGHEHKKDLSWRLSISNNRRFSLNVMQKRIEQSINLRPLNAMPALAPPR